MDASGLSALLSAGRSIMPRIETASRNGNASDTRFTRLSLRQKVESRAEFGKLGYTLQSITGSPLDEKGPAIKKTPPVAQGMTWCVERLWKLIVEDYKPGDNLAEVTTLLQRVKHLFRVYYDFVVTGKSNAELLTCCDFSSVFDVSFTLHRISLYLSLDPPRLKALMLAGGPNLEKFLLEEQLDIGPYRKDLSTMNKMLEKYDEADDNDREGIATIEEHASNDLAAYAMSWFFGNLHVAFVQIGSNAPRDAATVPWGRWKAKALKRLVKWSTSATWRDVLGDQLTDAMRPLYWDKQALIEFSHAGGLAALFGDWVNSTCKNLCEDVLSALPDAVWEAQTKHSLAAITREMQAKEAHESKDDVVKPIFINAFFNIYTRYGLPPFTAASHRENWRNGSTMFYHISHRVKNDPELASSLAQGSGAGGKVKAKAAWLVLMREYVHLPRGLERRYEWAHLNVSDRWDLFDRFGCNYPECEEKKALLAARSQRKKGVRDSELEDRLGRWGAKAMLCSACQESSYCSAPCQKAHWKAHKPECLQHRKQPTSVT